MQQILTTIYQTLKNNEALRAMITDVYQFPPEDLEYPYILLEMLEAGGDNGLPLGHGQESITLEIYIISTYKGIKEVNAITDLVQKLLEKTLGISPGDIPPGGVSPGGKVVLKLVSRTVTGQQETKTQHIRIGTLRFEGVWRG